MKTARATIAISRSPLGPVLPLDCNAIGTLLGVTVGLVTVGLTVSPT